MDVNFISERIAFLRIKKGSSARDMSLTLGQSEDYINRIENKRMLPSMLVFLNICEYLEITPKDFFDIKKENPKIISDINEKLLHVDEEMQELILTLLTKLEKNK